MSLTKNGNVKVVEDHKYVFRDCVAGALQLYTNAMVNSDASGNVKVAGDTASELFAGIVVAEVTQDSAASIADNQAELIGKGSGKVVKLKFTGVTKASIGVSVYVVDDESVALVATTTNDVLVGVIVDIAETNYCWVRI